MSLTRPVIVFLIAAVIVAQEPPAPTDHCSTFDSCTSCVKHNLCGWCSLPVVYPHNITGPQCAGFNVNGSHPFACNGEYSTKHCFQGYVCNPQNFTCDLAPPGNGVPKAVCEANCTNNGAVFLCNVTDKKCYRVPPGTPNATSLQVCQAECSHPSPHPAPPPPPPVSLWACNTTTGQCVPSTPGKGSSKSVCEQQCHKNNGTKYLCNKFLEKCYKLPPGVPGGKSLAKCEDECSPKPKPGPSPIFRQGLWRGVQIQGGYPTGETDLFVNSSVAYLVYITDTSRVTITGKPFHIHDSTLDLWIQITGGSNNGQWIKTISTTNIEPGPETTFMATAVGAIGGDVPTSILSAMTTSGQQVLTLSQCQTPECIFHMPDPTSTRKSKNPVGKRMDLDVSSALATMAVNDPCTQFADNCSYCVGHQYCGWCSVDVRYSDGSQGTQCAGFSDSNSTPFMCSGRFSTLDCTAGYTCSEEYQCVPTALGDGVTQNQCNEQCRPSSALKEKPAVSSALATMAVNDPCTKFAENCSFCLSHEFCGWCSVNVSYSDGSQGTQCAGFSGNGNSSAFVCTGRYSTLDCTDGYTCNDNYQCVLTTPGNGVSHRECETLCHPTPPPTPPQKQYVCNTTTKQCLACNKTYCPGSLPLGACEAACIHPKPGPHGQLLGTWRGIQIENDYHVGEYELVLNKTSASWYKAGTYQFSANVTSLGADVMIMHILDGEHKGWSFGTIYQLSYVEGQSNFFLMITLARGILGQALPTGFIEPMYTEGMKEYSFVKCTGNPCKFNKP